MALQPHERVVTIGGSAGAVEALREILPALPADFPWPVICVVHIPAHSPSLLPRLFAARCSLSVCEAEDKMALARGAVYFAPPDYHLLVEGVTSLALSIDEPVRFSRPSIDVLFESAAHAFGAGVVGIVLSGANDDGAAGLACVARAGGTSWVQAPAAAYASAMPEAALRAVPQAVVLDVSAIAPGLCALAGS